MARVGLCMIVKDEAHVIERCLSSIRNFVDHWTIVDTGSTDGTQQRIHELLAGIPGVLLERPWRDFGHNRSEALAATRPHAEYSFVIDADEIFLVPDGFEWPALTADSIALLHRTDTRVYWRESLVANRLPWAYRGVLHEYLHAPGTINGVRLPGPEVVGHFDGGRSRGVSAQQKYDRDASVLQAALRAEPDDSRYQYFLARSFQAGGRREAALSAYRRRVKMGGFDEEIFHSLLAIAGLLEADGDAEEVIVAYLRAWQYRPSRAEPLTSLARYCRGQDRHALARLFAGHALTLPRPEEILEVDEDVYRWAGLDEFAVASYWTGHCAESADACRRLLAGDAVPAEHRARVRENLELAVAELAADGPVEVNPALNATLPRQRSAAMLVDPTPFRHAAAAVNRGLPVVFVLGGSGVDLRTAGPVPDYETQELDCRHFTDEQALIEALPQTEPQAIVSFGVMEDYPRLCRLPYTLRSRWIHLPEELASQDAGARAMHCYLSDALVVRPDTAPPLVSVFTPAYRSGPRIERAWRSLAAQTHSSWEWAIIDDSDDDGATWQILEGIARRDHRVSLYRQHRRSGNIGELKNKLGHLGQGAYLVELDHDDELTPRALEWVAEAFRAHPDAGFVYSDCAEVREDGTNLNYPDGWAFGYGTCRPDTCWTSGGWRDLTVIEAPPINSKTIRHIVSTPNHLRSWRRDFYHDIGGHNRKLHVVDDYEICLRSFLSAPMVRIPEVGYLQYQSPGTNTQAVRNKEIQRLVRLIRTHYDAAIHARLVELGLDDFCWDSRGFGDLTRPNPMAAPRRAERVHHPLNTAMASRRVISPRDPMQDAATPAAAAH